MIHIAQEIAAATWAALDGRRGNRPRERNQRGVGQTRGGETEGRGVETRGGAEGTAPATITSRPRTPLNPEDTAARLSISSPLKAHISIFKQKNIFSSRQKDDPDVEASSATVMEIDKGFRPIFF
ncbi:hypothetical protein PHJA_001064800 [Phtheirospermum japonicum]|uniref:Uncharacterized protein n=1 Tax=Phtheirospermum japonicum TaxID=374723 RepID=A0A830C4K3_9LAMI|nr:hypothetical protein PHJA_001064800 [Phtheirospermum japonicum]